MATSSLAVKKILGNCKSNLSILVAANYSYRRIHSIGFGFSKNSLMANTPIGGGNCYSLPILSSTYSTTTLPIPTEEIRRVPWLMQPPDQKKKSNVYKFYRLLEKDMKEVVVESDPPPDADSRCLGSACQGWMAYIRKKDCQVFLFNPLSGKKIILPSIETLPAVKGVNRNSQSGLVESYISVFGPHQRPVTPERLSERIISDVVLSSSPMDDDCIAMVTYGRDNELAFCRIRDDPNCWTLLDSPFTVYTQIVYHSGKKLFYTLSEGRTELEAWDLHSDPIKRFHFEEDQTEVLGGMPFPYRDDEVKLKLRNWPERKDYLVYDHQSQELFVVTRHCYNEHDLLPDNKTTTFGIFKVDFINYHLVKLQLLKNHSIGNLAIFLSNSGGFTLSTTEFPELRPSSIYFADNRPGCYSTDSDWRYQDLVIYDYEEDSIMDKIKSISLVRKWFIPDA